MNLRVFVAKASVLCKNKTVTEKDALSLLDSHGESLWANNYDELRILERQMLIQALKLHKGNQARAATIFKNPKKLSSRKNKVL